jgi:hypothetical protein
VKRAEVPLVAGPNNCLLAVSVNAPPAVDFGKRCESVTDTDVVSVTDSGPIADRRMTWWRIPRRNLLREALPSGTGTLLYH